MATLQPTQKFNLNSITQTISLKVIIKAVFGVQKPERMQEFEEAALEYVKAFTPLLQFVPPLRRNLGGIGAWSRFKKATARFHQLLFEEIVACRQDKEEREDILSMLVAAHYDNGRGMSDEELCDELKTLLIAGNISTSTAIAWAFYWIYRNQDIYQCLQNELNELDHPPVEPAQLTKLPYLNAVCNEALRLYPVTPGIGRKLKEPFTLLGRELPVGTVVHPAIPLAHLDPKIYPDPLNFKPERFLERKYTPFEFLPFGGGMRRCIGAAFAMYEMKIVLGSILKQHSMKLAEDRLIKPVPQGLVVGPKAVNMIYLGLADK